jgi:hypothetical protein
MPRQLSRTRQGAEVYPPRRSSQKKPTLWSFRWLVISVHWSACAKRNFPVELVRKGHVETLSVAFQRRMVGSGGVRKNSLAAYWNRFGLGIKNPCAYSALMPAAVTTLFHKTS